MRRAALFRSQPEEIDNPPAKCISSKRRFSQTRIVVVASYPERAEDYTLKLSREEVLGKISQGESLEEYDLRGIDLKNADLKGADFRKAKLRYADFSGSDLSGADFREANLRHAVMRDANLSGADLRGADLTHVNFIKCNLTNAKTDGAAMEDTKGLSHKVFFTQKVLDALNDEDRIQIDGNFLTIIKPDGSKPKFEILPAYRFLRVEGPEEDDHGLVGKVKTQKEVKDMGVEICHTSAIYHDVCYEIEEGFIGLSEKSRIDLIEQPTEVREAPLSDTPSDPALKEPKEKTDEDLLADLIMKTMR